MNWNNYHIGKNILKKNSYSKYGWKNTWEKEVSFSLQKVGLLGKDAKGWPIITAVLKKVVPEKFNPFSPIFTPRPQNHPLFKCWFIHFVCDFCHVIADVFMSRFGSDWAYVEAFSKSQLISLASLIHHLVWKWWPHKDFKIRKVYKKVINSK